MRRDLGDQRGVAESLEALALVGTGAAPDEEVAQQLLEAESLRIRTGSAVPPRMQAELDRCRRSLTERRPELLSGPRSDQPGGVF